MPFSWKKIPGYRLSGKGAVLRGSLTSSKSAAPGKEEQAGNVDLRAGGHVESSVHAARRHIAGKVGFRRRALQEGPPHAAGSTGRLWHLLLK